MAEKADLKVTKSLKKSPTEYENGCGWCFKRVEEIPDEIKEAKEIVADYEKQRPKLTGDNIVDEANAKSFQNELRQRESEVSSLVEALDRAKKSNKQERDRSGKFVCHSCGKGWEESALGKPWSIELERGADWVRENSIKKLQGA